MTAGLRTWNENGVLDVEISRRLTRFVGSFITGTSGGTFPVSGVPANADLWFFVNPANRNAMGGHPDIVLSGHTFTWTFPNSLIDPASAVVYYGYY